MTPRVAALAASALFLVPASAQEILRERTSDSVQVAPGVYVDRTVETRRNSVQVIESLAYVPTELRGSLQLVCDASGAPVPLARALLNADAFGVFGLTNASLVIQEGRIANWPANGPAIVVEPEGAVLLEDVAPLAQPTIEVAPEVSLPLLISREPVPDPASARILPGPWRGTDTARYVSPNDATWVLMGRRQREPWIDASAFGGVDRTLTLHAEPFVSTSRDIRDNEALLIVPRTAMGGAPVQERTFDVRLALPEDLATARFAIRAGDWLIRDTAATPLTRPETTEPRRAVGIDNSTGKVFLVEAPTDIRQPGASRTELATAMRESGATDAIELPSGDSLLLVPGRLQGTGREREGAEAELILALSRRIYRAGAGYGFERIRIADHVLDMPEIGRHPYAALGDSRLDAGPKLDGFWAGKFSREPNARNDATLILARPAEIGAIDLVHASRAGFSPSLNLKRARIHLSEGAGKPWKLVAEINNETPVQRQRIDISPPMRAVQVRIEVLEPTFIEGSDTVRLAELVVWGRN